MSSNGYDIGNNRSRSGSAIDIGYFEILGEIGRKITPANYDDCRGIAAGFDWRGVGEIADCCALRNTFPIFTSVIGGHLKKMPEIQNFQKKGD